MHINTDKDLSAQEIAKLRFAAKLNRQTDDLKECCNRVVSQLGHINTMMVCSDCKSIIKTFKDEIAFRNYVRFCSSRSRMISTLHRASEERWYVVFQTSSI